MEYENEENQQGEMLEQAAEAGRGGDTVIAHLTIGEVVVPVDIANDPEFSQVLQSVFQSYNANLAEFTVGDPANKINPETGQPEFFKLGKFLKKAAGVALPVLGTMIPGVGPVIGGALGGAAGGALQGKGLKGVGLGAALGGLGGFATSAMGGVGDIIGKVAGTPLAGVTGNAAMQGPTLGSGIAGMATRGLSSVGSGLSSLASSGGSSLSNLGTLARIGGSLYSSGQENRAMKGATADMLAAQKRSEDILDPYQKMGLQSQQQLSQNLSEGFNPEDVTRDAGYQMRLNEGMGALNASLAAQGMGQSGAAMKALEDYRQQHAQNEYSNAYDRWLQKNQQLAGAGGVGVNTAGNLSNVYGETGNALANQRLGLQANKSKRLAEILASLGGKWA